MPPLPLCFYVLLGLPFIFLFSKPFSSLTPSLYCIPVCSDTPESTLVMRFLWGSTKLWLPCSGMAVAWWPVLLTLCPLHLGRSWAHGMSSWGDHGANVGVAPPKLTLFHRRLTCVPATLRGAFHTLSRLGRLYQPYCVQEGEKAWDSGLQQVELGVVLRTVWFKALFPQDPLASMSPMYLGTSQHTWLIQGRAFFLSLIHEKAFR